MSGGRAVLLVLVLVAACSTGGRAKPAQPTPPAVSATPPPATPTSGLPTSGLPTSGVPTSNVSTSNVPTSAAASSTPAVIDYSHLLGAVSAAGDVVLVDPDTGTTVRTVIPHDANGPAISVAWDPVHRIVYFGRGGTCASVWRHTLGEEAVHLLGTGHHPVLSPDGTRLAVANGCTPGRSQSDGITVRAAGTGAPMLRLPIVVPTAG
jgi:hypothetical protein